MHDAEKSTTPEGFHSLEYARNLLENFAALPAKGNLEIVSDSLISLSKTRKFSLQIAHDYMARAIRLAREQGIKIDYFFFQSGVYLDVRPEEPDRYDNEKKLELQYRAHGCHAGWIYVSDGGPVRRCPQCASGTGKSNGRGTAGSGSSPDRA